MAAATVEPRPQHVGNESGVCSVAFFDMFITALLGFGGDIFQCVDVKLRKEIRKGGDKVGVGGDMTREDGC